MSPRLSKSKCRVPVLEKALSQVHRPELAAEPDGSAASAIIEQGREVGFLARELFPGGVEICSAGLDHAVRTTLVENSEVPAIFEGVIEGDGILVRADVLQRRKENHWRLVEVKSTSDLRDQHVEDVAIQSYVLSFSGAKLASIRSAHINRDYLRNGRQSPAKGLPESRARECKVEEPNT